jgi:hypothetical protein
MRRNDFIYDSFVFIEENIIEIILVSVIFFLLVSYLVLNNVTFPSDKAKVEKVIVMETMENKNNNAIINFENKQKFKEDLKKGFCKKSVENLSPKEIEEEMSIENAKCKSLGDKSVCTNALCCVWATTKKGKGICLGGDKSGPTKNPPNMQIDEYYYLDKKFKVN